MFLVFIASIPAAGSTLPPIRRDPRALAPRVMRLGHEANCSSRSSVEVRMSGAIPPLPHTPSNLYLTATIHGIQMTPQFVPQTFLTYHSLFISDEKAHYLML